MTQLKLQRRQFTAQLTALAVGALATDAARSQAHETIQLMVGFPPGGVSDRVARIAARYLERAIGETVVADNRSGAGGVVAARLLKAARPDGRTLMLAPTHVMAVTPQLLKKVGYDPGNDFVRLGGLGSVVDCLAISPSIPARNLAEWVAWVRADSRRAHVGVSALGSAQDVAVRLMSMRYGIELTPVPYSGSAPIMVSMLGDQISAGFASVSDFHHHHREGRIRVVALFGEQHHPLLPAVPTFREAGVSGLELVQCYGVYGPRGLPESLKERLSRGVSDMAGMREVKALLMNMGVLPEAISAQELLLREKQYRTHWNQLLQQVGASET